MSVKVARGATPPVEDTRDVILTVDIETARVIRTLVGSVEGGGEIRKKTDALFFALDAAGISASKDIAFSRSTTKE